MSSIATMQVQQASRPDNAQDQPQEGGIWLWDAVKGDRNRGDSFAAWLAKRQGLFLT